MSEPSPEGGNTSGDTPAAEPEFTPITSQEDLNRVLSDRIARERAKTADYKDLKAKAAKLDEIENANRSEAEKAQTRITELESRLGEAQRDSLRRVIAGRHGITDSDDIDLFLTGSDEDTLTRQAKRLAEREADRKKQGNRVPREGTNPAANDSEDREAVRRIFSG